jgi:hypothetical protein
MFTEKQIANIDITHMSVTVLKYIKKLEKSNKFSINNIELTDELKIILRIVWFHRNLVYRAYEKYIHNKQTAFKYILIAYRYNFGLFLLKQIQYNGSYELVYFNNQNGLARDIINKIHNIDDSNAYNIFSSIYINENINIDDPDKLLKYRILPPEELSIILTGYEHKIQYNHINPKVDVLIIQDTENEFVFVYMFNHKFYQIYISKEFMLKPMFIRDIIPKHNYYTNHFIRIVSDKKYEIYHKTYKSTKSLISDYIKNNNNNIMYKPHINIIINEDIKNYIRDILFTSNDVYKIYGYDKIVFHDIEMYKNILIFYKENNIIWIIKASDDNNSFDIVLSLDFSCLLIQNTISNICCINKEEYLLPEDTFEKLTIKWDEEFMNTYNLSSYDEIMKAVDRFEQTINNILNNYVVITNIINHNNDNDIINFNIIIYYKYKYWLFVCNNKKILRPYFLRDFIPNVD